MSEREQAIERLRKLLEARPELCEVVIDLAEAMKTCKMPQYDLAL